MSRISRIGTAVCTAGIVLALSASGVVQPRASTEPTTEVQALQATGVAAGAPAAGYRLTAAGARWNPCRTLRYRISASHLPRGAAKDVHGAFRRVSRATGIKFRYAGRSAGTPLHKKRSLRSRTVWRGSDIVVAWARARDVRTFRRGAVGIGGSWWRGTGRVKPRFQGFVVIDPAYRLTPGFGRGSRKSRYHGTRGQVLMHEIGHVMGLDHVSRKSQIMYPSMTRKYARFGAGDRAGLRRVGRSQGCIRGY